MLETYGPTSVPTWGMILAVLDVIPSIAVRASFGLTGAPLGHREGVSFLVLIGLCGGLVTLRVARARKTRTGLRIAICLLILLACLGLTAILSRNAWFMAL